MTLRREEDREEKREKNSEWKADELITVGAWA